MRIYEVMDYQELPGTTGNWAPYIIRRFTDERGEYFNVYQQGHQIAHARLSRDQTYVSDVQVLPEHRRRGIATAIYNYIENMLGHPLQPSPLSQSDAAKALWKTRSDA